MGEVVNVSKLMNTFSIKLASSTITVRHTASTTVYLGTGEVTTFDEAIKKGVKIYVFGVLDEEEESMKVEKIVVKNPSRLSRDNLKTQEEVKEVSFFDEVEPRVFTLWLSVWKGVTFTTAYSAERLEQSFNYLQSPTTTVKELQVREVTTPKNEKLEASAKPKNII